MLSKITTKQGLTIEETIIFTLRYDIDREETIVQVKTMAKMKFSIKITSIT